MDEIDEVRSDLHAGISPLGADAPTEDRVGLAGWSMATGIVAAVMWFGGLTYIQSRLVNGVTAQSVAQLDPHAADVNFMIYGILLGLVFGFATSWFLMAPIPSSYRRGGLSMVAALAGAVTGMTLTFALRAMGPLALFALTIVAALVAALLARRATQAAR